MITGTKQTKAEREKAAFVERFAASSTKPPSDDISALLGETAQGPAPKEIQAGPELADETPTALPTQESATPPVEPPPASDHEAHKKPKKTAPAPATPTPWANAHPKVEKPFMMRLPEDLHMKLVWLKEHLPNTSIQKLVRTAIEKEVEKLIKENYK